MISQTYPERDVLYRRLPGSSTGWARVVRAGLCVLCLCAVGAAQAQFGLDRIKDNARKAAGEARRAAEKAANEAVRGKEPARRTERPQPRAATTPDEAATKVEPAPAEATEVAETPQGRVAGPAAAKAGGVIVFSSQPIDPKAPANLTTSFKAGDRIYGLMRPLKPWREIYGENAKEKAELLLLWTLDGKEKVGGYIVVVKPEYIDGTATPIEIAPDLAHMTAYRDPGIQFGDYRDIKKGPCHFTLELSQLKPGKHTLEFWINDFGKKHAIGSFEISGDDYSAYAELHARIKEEVSGGRRLPAARKTDKAMAETMVGLLKNAGWTEVLRLNIVDQDWWIDRMAGGESPIQSRHMAAAAAYKDKDGQCYYRVCTFHQQALITGGFGPLELTHQGDPIPIPEANLNQ